MKINRILVLILILLMAINITNAQKMSDLYTFLINDCYKKSLKEGYISKQDTLYFTCGFCDCQRKCFDYDIDLKNDKIQFGVPTVSGSNPEVIFYRLSSPELENQYLVINVGIYNMVFRENNNQEFIYTGTIKYIFQYEKKAFKYVLKSKKEYGL